MGRKNKLYAYPQWFTEFLEDNPVLDFLETGQWEIGQQISEKAQHPLFGESDVLEAVGVFHCKGVFTNEPYNAILKLKIQIPNLDIYERPSEDPQKRAQQAAEPPEHTQIEARALADLTEKGCTATPKLLYHQTMKQTERLPVPGGYVIIILMEKVPGTCVYDIWKGMEESEKDLLRASFKESLTEVVGHHYRPNDPRQANLIWDDKNRKCYIVDLERFLITKHSSKRLIDETRIFVAWYISDD